MKFRVDLLNKTPLHQLRVYGIMQKVSMKLSLVSIIEPLCKFLKRSRKDMTALAKKDPIALNSPPLRNRDCMKNIELACSVSLNLPL